MVFDFLSEYAQIIKLSLNLLLILYFLHEILFYTLLCYYLLYYLFILLNPLRVCYKFAEGLTKYILYLFGEIIII